MIKAIAINGSPHMEKGNTAILLEAFMEGMQAADCESDVFYASRLKVSPCSCKDMYCWYQKPGECFLKDEMQTLYPALHQADILVLATPVYVPLPGDMQNVINRLCPLINPVLETRLGRTRARLHENVNIRKFVLVSTGGWWEKENFGTVVRIAQELAETCGAEFAGAVLRPHAGLMFRDGGLTEDGKKALTAARKAGSELIENGKMNTETLDAISRPLIGEDQLLNMLNQLSNR